MGRRAVGVTEYSDDAERPCAWHFYKSPERIPDAVYARLGKERPGA